MGLLGTTPNLYFNFSKFAYLQIWLRNCPAAIDNPIGRGGLDLSEKKSISVVFDALGFWYHQCSYINALENCKQLGRSFMNRTKKIVDLGYFLEEPKITLVEAQGKCCSLGHAIVERYASSHYSNFPLMQKDLILCSSLVWITESNAFL